MESTSATACNGWTNYATWRVNLEIVDDYIQSLEPGELTFAGMADFADWLQETVEEVVSNYGQADESAFATQYALAFLNDVNWYEIAKTHTDDNPDLIVFTGR